MSKSKTRKEYVRNNENNYCKNNRYMWKKSGKDMSDYIVSHYPGYEKVVCRSFERHM